MGPYLGDYLEDTQYLDFMWDSNDADGASVTRAADGTISVYKGNSDAQSVAGVTDTEDFDGLTGIHHIRIDLSADAFYETGYDYNVVLSAATIDGQTVNAVLASFSIENRFQEVDVVKWLGQAVTLSTGNKPDVNVNEVSDDSTAADNLELQFDTTGLAGDTFPATQSQLAGIANVGAAVHIPADSYTLTTGTQSSGTVASTPALDGTNHEHTDDAGAMDLYYEFAIGSGLPIGVVVKGYLNGNNDDLEVYGYDWVAAGWVQLGELNGKAASTNEVYSYDLFVNMVGSGANQGIVRVRFTDGAFTLSTATLAIDQIFLSFSRSAEGYENGAIWIDTGAGNTDTVVGVDGTARNPVSTMAAANTLAASTNLNTFHVAAGSTITFAASQDNQMFHGMNWTLVLGGQSISGTHISGASVSGICTGASRPKFTDCHFGATTLPPSHLTDCGFENTITAGSAGNFSVDRCHAMGSPIFDFGGGLNSSDVNFSGWSGSIEIQNMGAGSGTYTMALDGNGELTINANCSATSNLSLDGNFRVTDNASGAVTITPDDDTTDITAILADTAEMQPKLPTNFIMGSSDQTDKDDEIDAILADVTGIDGDAMRGTDGANTTVPDVAGTAAGLHATTDGKVDTVQGDVTTIAGDVVNIDGDAMRGTDGANTTVPDVAGTAAGLHGTTDAKVDAVQADVTTIAGDVVNIDGDAMRGTDGANTTVPDVAGTAAGLHATTESNIRGADSDDLKNISDEIGLLNNITVADILAGAVDGTIDVQEAFTVIMALLSAKGSSVAGNVYSYRQQDNTVKAAQTIGANTVTTVIS